MTLLNFWPFLGAIWALFGDKVEKAKNPKMVVTKEHINIITSQVFIFINRDAAIYRQTLYVFEGLQNITKKSPEPTGTKRFNLDEQLRYQIGQVLAG